MTELVRLYREVGGSPRENPRNSQNEIAALRREISNIPIVSAQELRQLTEGEFWCKNCGTRIRDPSQKQCGRCGSETASKSPKYRCTSCSSGVDPNEPRCLCGGTEAMLSTEAEVADSKPDGRHICASCREPVNVEWPSCVHCGSTKAFELIG